MPGVYLEYIKAGKFVVPVELTFQTETVQVQDDIRGLVTTSKWIEKHNWKEIKAMLKPAVEACLKYNETPLDNIPKSHHISYGENVSLGYLIVANKLSTPFLSVLDTKKNCWTDDEDDDDELLGINRESSPLRDHGAEYTEFMPTKTAIRVCVVRKSVVSIDDARRIRKELGVRSEEIRNYFPSTSHLPNEPGPSSLALNQYSENNSQDKQTSNRPGNVGDDRSSDSETENIPRTFGDPDEIRDAARIYTDVINRDIDSGDDPDDDLSLPDIEPNPPKKKKGTRTRKKSASYSPSKSKRLTHNNILSLSQEGQANFSEEETTYKRSKKTKRRRTVAVVEPMRTGQKSFEHVIGALGFDKRRKARPGTSHGADKVHSGGGRSKQPPAIDIIAPDDDRLTIVNPPEPIPAIPPAIPSTSKASPPPKEQAQSPVENIVEKMRRRMNRYEDDSHRRYERLTPSPLLDSDDQRSSESECGHVSTDEDFDPEMPTLIKEVLSDEEGQSSRKPAQPVENEARQNETPALTRQPNVQSSLEVTNQVKTKAALKRMPSAEPTFPKKQTMPSASNIPDKGSVVAKKSSTPSETVGSLRRESSLKKEKVTQRNSSPETKARNQNSLESQKHKETLSNSSTSSGSPVLSPTTIRNQKAMELMDIVAKKLFKERKGSPEFSKIMKMKRSGSPEQSNKMKKRSGHSEHFAKSKKSMTSSVSSVKLKKPTGLPDAANKTPGRSENQDKVPKSTTGVDNQVKKKIGTENPVRKATGTENPVKKTIGSGNPIRHTNGKISVRNPERHKTKKIVKFPNKKKKIKKSVSSGTQDNVEKAKNSSENSDKIEKAKANVSSESRDKIEKANVSSGSSDKIVKSIVSSGNHDLVKKVSVSSGNHDLVKKASVSSGNHDSLVKKVSVSSGNHDSLVKKASVSSGNHDLVRKQLIGSPDIHGRKNQVRSPQLIQKEKTADQMDKKKKTTKPANTSDLVTKALEVFKQSTKDIKKKQSNSTTTIDVQRQSTTLVKTQRQQKPKMGDAQTQTDDLLIVPQLTNRAFSPVAISNRFLKVSKSCDASSEEELCESPSPRSRTPISTLETSRLSTSTPVHHPALGSPNRDFVEDDGLFSFECPTIPVLSASQTILAETLMITPSASSNVESPSTEEFDSPSSPQPGCSHWVTTPTRPPSPPKAALMPPPAWRPPRTPRKINFDQRADSFSSCSEEPNLPSSYDMDDTLPIGSEASNVNQSVGQLFHLMNQPHVFKAGINLIEKMTSNSVPINLVEEKLGLGESKTDKVEQSKALVPIGSKPHKRDLSPDICEPVADKRLKQFVPAPRRSRRDSFEDAESSKNHAEDLAQALVLKRGGNDDEASDAEGLGEESSLFDYISKSRCNANNTYEPRGDEFDLSQRSYCMLNVVPQYDLKSRLYKIHSKTVRETPFPQISEHFKVIVPDLIGIFEGRIASVRHRIFQRGMEGKQDLRNMMVSVPFTSSQNNAIVYLIFDHVLRKRHCERYVSCVLAPEALIRIYARINKIPYEYAETEMCYGACYEGELDDSISLPALE